MASQTKVVKDLGWGHISLTQQGFKGAAHAYQSTNGGEVALCFNLHEAFIVEDEQGLFGVEDLKQGIIQAKDIDVEFTGEIEGAHVVAWEEDGEVGFDEIKLTELGINDFEVKESLKVRLLQLAELDKMVDMPM